MFEVDLFLGKTNEVVVFKTGHLQNLVIFIFIRWSFFLALNVDKNTTLELK